MNELQAATPYIAERRGMFVVEVPCDRIPRGPFKTRQAAENVLRNILTGQARKANPKGKVPTVEIEPRPVPLERIGGKWNSPKKVTNAERKWKAKQARKIKQRDRRHERAVAAKPKEASGERAADSE